MIHATSARLFIYAGLLMVVFLTLPEMVKAGTKNTGEACVTNTDCVSNQCEQVGTGLAYCVAKKIGDVCSSGNWGDNECITGYCEDAENIAPADAYCVCQTAAHCATQYAQVDPSALNWECTDNDDDQIYDLHYCKLKSTGRLYYPVDPPPSSVTGLIGDNEATVQNAGDELKQMISAPQLRIAIPGLSFTSVDKLVQKTEADGATYMYFPFLGEYISAMYKYAIAVMGIIAVIMIIVGGVIWITSGGIPERVNQAKTIIVRSVVGMILAVGSYTLLYTINPELVQFRNLKVLTIQGVPLTDIVDIDFRTGGSASTNEFSDTILTSNTVGGPDIATDAARCEASPSQPSGIGDTKYLGQLDCNSSRTRKSLLDIKNILLHDGGRTAKGTVDYWKSNCQKTGKCVNTHYFIERDGTTYQLLDEKKVAIHTPSWNSASIGIDLATVGPADRSTASCLQCKYNGKCKSYSGKPRSDEKTSKEQALLDCSKGFTEAQYTSLKKLIDSIVARTGVTKDGESIRAHCNASGNHSDPVGFDWSKIGISPKQSQSCSFNPEYSQKLQADADKIFGS